MGCVLAVCTCYFVDRSGSGWCSCRGVEHCCGGCVRLGTCLGGWACCFCVASFQSAVLAGDTKKAAKALMFLPPNMGSGDLLFRAVEEDKARIVRLLLDRGANPSIVLPDGRLPLETAAQLGFKDVLRQFVAKGARPGTGEGGTTPLVFIAVKFGKLDVVRFLVEECGVKLNSDQMTFWNQVPLTRAVELDHVHIVEYLCEHGADVEAESYPNTDPNQFTETALSVAIKKGNLRMVHIIMKHGAQRPHKIKFRRRLYDMDELARFFHQDTILEFFSKWEIRVAMMHRDDMVEAAAKGELERVDVQLQREMPDINHVNKKLGWAALHKAAENEDLEMIEYLLDHGADINVRNPDGWTPLLHSVKLNALDSMDLLLRRGADPNVRNYRGESPFSIAVTLGYEVILNGLLRAGAGEKSSYAELQLLVKKCHHNVRHMMEAEMESIMINRGDGLITMALEGKTEMITRLVELYGADVNHVHSSDKQQARTALIAAAETGWVDCVLELIRLGARTDCLLTTGDNALLLAAQWGHLHMVQTLLGLGMDVNFVNETDGRNCLRVATDKGFLPVVQEVVAAGAIVDWTDKMNFQTALHRACIHGFFEIAVFLLNSGANIDRRDKMSTSPLLHACINNNLKVADMLIKRGAQWNAKSTAGKTPLEQAIEEQRGDMIRLLNSYRKKLMHNRCKDLERSAKLRNIVGVREILGSTVDCVHCFPKPFKRAHEELLSVMEVQGKGMPAEEYKRVKDIHELFVATKKLLKREFATLQVLEWVKKGDIRTMQRYLEAELGDLDLNLQSGKAGTTPLISACETNNLDIVLLLLRHGAKANIGNKFTQFTALMAAAKNANLEMCKALLRSGANPLAVDLMTGKTADRYALSAPCIRLIKEYTVKIREIRDDERREKELQIYSQELGVPLDWFALKRQDMIADVQAKARAEEREKLKKIGARMKRRAAGLPSDSESEAGGSRKSRSHSHTHRSGHTGTSRPSTVRTRDTSRSRREARAEAAAKVDYDGPSSDASSTDSSFSFTSGSSYSYVDDADAIALEALDDDALAKSRGSSPVRRGPDDGVEGDVEHLDVDVDEASLPRRTSSRSLGEAKG